MSKKIKELLITKEEFWAFEKVRESGATNMFDTRRVAELSGLTKENVFRIINKYSTLKTQFKKIII